MSISPSLIPTTAQTSLEATLREKLANRTRAYGRLGELESLALRLGLIQNATEPSFIKPHVLVFAADHGLIVERKDGVLPQSTARLIQSVLASQMPLSVFARNHGMGLTLVDSGVAELVTPHSGLLARKIAHGTRNARVNTAMSVDQADAAIRAGMEIADGLEGNAVACAGIGAGTHESAALVLSRLTGTSMRDYILPGTKPNKDKPPPVMVVMRAIQHRHKDVSDPVEVLAAMGGFEVAMMVGLMLTASSKRHLILVDGMAACAALMVAARIAPAITDYCVFCRSTSHLGLDQALSHFNALALLELGLDCTDGTGAALTFPLVNSAAALLSKVVEDKNAATVPPKDASWISTMSATL